MSYKWPLEYDPWEIDPHQFKIIIRPIRNKKDLYIMLNPFRASPADSLNFCIVWRINSTFYVLPT